LTSLLVGVDVGTTSSKAVVFTTDGRPVAQGRAHTPWVLTPHGAELDAVALLDSARDALGRALSDAPDGAVLALGVTSMGESGVLLDGRGRSLAPVIAWHDTRDAAEVDELAESIGARFARRTGLPMRGQWSLTKHRWLLTNYPQAKESVRRLNVAEWVVRGLGGAESAEQSLASRTGWLDLATRRWWTETLEWSGARSSLLPELVTAGTPLGQVDDDAVPARLAGAVLTVAGHDHQAAAVGAGAAGAGDVLDSCGSAEALIRTVPPGLDPASVAMLAAAGITTGWHVLADRWCLLGGTQGGLALQRVMAMLGRTAEDLAELDRGALALGQGGVGIAGVDTDSLSISGVTSGTGPAHVWQAALEAVTAQAAQVQDAMTAVAGQHQSLVVAGGWTHSHALLAVKRRVLGDLRVAGTTEAGARGAALLAGLAAGVYDSPEEFPDPSPTSTR
jgi:sugar (pentulose or hexulose) kinase